MKDPYKVLGVDRDASEEEIKVAYHTLIKKYHPDKFADNDLAELAREKTQEIKAAYDDIKKNRSGADSKVYYGDVIDEGTSDSAFYQDVRHFIDKSNFFEAEKMLNSVSYAERGAEWNYFYGYLLMKKGFYADAGRYFDTACSMDPENSEYKATRDSLRRKGEQYSRGYRTQSNTSTCDCCTSLLCADCCCECMGGDFIACC